MAARVEIVERLSAAQAEDVLRLRDEIAARDGFSPLSDPVVGAIRHRKPGAHLLQSTGDRIVGYAHIDSRGSQPVAELVVGPAGEANALLSKIAGTATPGLRIWAKGDASPLNELLPSLGFTLQRMLLKLHRPLAEPELAQPAWADGVTVRTFVVGADEAAWLEVNNAAFADHPEQSGWTPTDIEAREQEPWFDPNGFFLAELDGKLAGFHWTKRHSQTTGEVYIIGVAPQAQGRHLGEALLLQGLHYLRDAGAERVFLYVEASNAGAIALYERLGFTRWSADRLFTYDGTSAPS